MKIIPAAAIILFLGVVFILSAPATAYAELDCKSLNGNWSGKMRGILGGATSMSIKNCRTSWKLPDRRMNYCRFKEKAGKVEYSCSLGSRGVVEIKGNKITMRNVYTARAHGSYVVNVTKTGN